RPRRVLVLPAPEAPAGWAARPTVAAPAVPAPTAEGPGAALAAPVAVGPAVQAVPAALVVRTTPSGGPAGSASCSALG
ncbi:hypothetical protein, partial [Actinomadura rudentiformis]|uniref:hypothetical protein n=1 Tax=Actinomadura rudentiformis TaxID=359158 RepID=UPI00384CAEA9